MSSAERARKLIERRRLSAAAVCLAGSPGGDYSAAGATCWTGSSDARRDGQLASIKAESAAGNRGLSAAIANGNGDADGRRVVRNVSQFGWLPPNLFARRRAPTSAIELSYSSLVSRLIELLWRK